MANSSILGAGRPAATPPGKDIDALGPSDSSDSGSDVQGERSLATAPDDPGQWGAVVAGGRSDSDSLGTGERASADGDPPREGADILPDRVVDLDEDAPLEDPDVDVEDLDVSVDPEDEEVDDEGENKRRDVDR